MHACIVVREELRAAVCRAIPVHGGAVWGPGEYLLWVDRPEGARACQYAIIENGRFVRLAEDMDT
jgi:hypothetical protein